MTSFIGTYTIPDVSICDRIINHFESHPAIAPGGFMLGSQYVIDPQRKSCDQVLFDFDHPLCQHYEQQLQSAADQYIQQYPWSNNYDRWMVREPIQIQRYRPGQAYHDYHTERTGAQGHQAARHLAFMTYLNTVTDQGGTEFPQQHTVITPKKGVTVIWPVDWTHTHRGIASLTQTKYIVTGWFSFY
jgi:hypothetical protein